VLLREKTKEQEKWVDRIRKEKKNLSWSSFAEMLVAFAGSIPQA
jgi:hypothetical protein